MKTKHQLLTDKYFLIGLVVLIVNDLFLKYSFSGIITGKLSDISGLFIFPFFWSALLTKHTKKIYIITAVLFILWKLPITTNGLFIINNFLGTNFYRTVDLTDLFTLGVLPISYKYFCFLQTERTSVNWSWPTLSICIVSAFSFIATTIPSYPLSKTVLIEQSYTLDITKEKLLTDRLSPNYLSDSLQANMTDSVFIIQFNNGLERIFAKTKISHLNETQINLELTSIEKRILGGGFLIGINEKRIQKLENQTKEDYIIIFKKEVVDVIQSNKKKSRIMFSNPRIDSTEYYWFY